MKMLIVLSCVFACSVSTGLAQTNAGSTASLEELMKKVLTALEMKDQSALEKLAITEDGYHKYIRPGIHANTPGTNEKRFYSMFQRGSAAGIASTLKEFGGRKMEFIRISMGTPIRQTKGYRLLPSPSVTVKDASGQERTLNLTGAIVEHDGGYQVLRTSLQRHNRHPRSRRTDDRSNPAYYRRGYRNFVCSSAKETCPIFPGDGMCCGPR